MRAGRVADLGVVDVLGLTGRYRDPLWRVEVHLTELERDLLRCWWVRRLAFIAHAGAAAALSTQTYSRLEHSLGLLALVAHYDPADRVTRATALLHDVGHLPLSHTLEHVAGLDHHALGAQRIEDLHDVLTRHGVAPGEVVATDTGERPSVLSGAPGVLKLDHLESLVRGGRAHGRTRQAPPVTLDRLAVVDGCVSTDRETAGYLAELVVGEARWVCSDVNAVATGVVRHLGMLLLRDAPTSRREQIAASTDDEFWALLFSDPVTAEAARALRRDPLGWQVVDPGTAAGAAAATSTGAIGYAVTRLYLDVPLVEVVPMGRDDGVFSGLPVLPWRRAILAPAST